MIASISLRAVADDVEARLQGLIGKDETTIRRQFGVPGRIERNRIQTFFVYSNFNAWRTTGRPEPFGYSHGYSGLLGLRGRTAFECTTILVFSDGALRAYSREGSFSRR